MASVRILHLEDDPLDAALIQGRLDADGYADQLEVVPSEAAFRHALRAGHHQLILADYRIPGFDGLTALKIACEVRPGIPFIFVSGEMGEELAIASLKAGACDYVLKDNLNRLVPAVQNALAKAEAEHAKARAEAALHDLAKLWQGTFDAVSDAIVIVGDDRRIIRGNKAFLALAGMAHENDILGRHCGEILSGTDGSMESCPLLATLQRRERARTEIPLHDKWLEVFSYPLEINSAHNLWGAVHIIRDITAVKQAQIAMKEQADALAATNTALKVMLNHSRQAETALQEKIMSNIGGLILPYLDQLDSLSSSENARPYLCLIRNNIKNLISSFTKDLSAPILGLTQREVQIADLIIKGKSSKEIAQLLRLSRGTVDCYRDQIRDKLEVKNKKINLRSYLLSKFSE